jgi:hypothetical protein
MGAVQQIVAPFSLFLVLPVPLQLSTGDEDSELQSSLQTRRRKFTLTATLTLLRLYESHQSLQLVCRDNDTAEGKIQRAVLFWPLL